MRIALIQPPIEDFYSTPQRTYPLGLTYLTGAINDLPVEINILDFITGYGRQTIPVPNSFNTIMPFLPYDRSPISAFHTYYHYGASWKEIKEHFRINHYDLYAISSNFYTYSEEVLQLAGIIKSVSPNSKVIVGGQNIGPEHDLFMKCPDIDYLIMGEGEVPFREFVLKFLEHKDDLSHVPGIWDHKTQHWTAQYKDPSFNRKPAMEYLPAEKYLIAGKPSIMISTSRGCPMGCRFCSVSRTFGSPLRLKNVKMIIDEMQNAFDRGIRAFDIEDDNFTFVKEHCIELLKQISSQFGDKISLYAMNGLSAEHLDEKIIDLLIDSGMKLMNLSIATSSEDKLRSLHRNTSVQHFKHIVNYASSEGLKIMGHFIAGLPGQSIEEILETMKVLSELPLVLGISPFYFIPGMDLQVPKTPGNCKDARLSRFWPADELLNELDLITLFRLSRWINYVKDQMEKNKINKLRFSNIAETFPNDPFISKFINEHEIYGIDAKTLFFKHLHSKKVISHFLDIFMNSYIYCA